MHYVNRYLGIVGTSASYLGVQGSIFRMKAFVKSIDKLELSYFAKNLRDFDIRNFRPKYYVNPTLNEVNERNVHRKLKSIAAHKTIKTAVSGAEMKVLW